MKISSDRIVGKSVFYSAYGVALSFGAPIKDVYTLGKRGLAIMWAKVDRGGGSLIVSWHLFH